jgi:hypothetical protein
LSFPTFFGFLLESLFDWFMSCLVGVTGSGKGMTEVALKQKHKFEFQAEDQ